MMKKLQIAILGAGAMGSFFGAMLARMGQNITLLDINEDHINAINTSGLQLEYNGTKENIRSLRAIKPAELDIQPDLFIIFTKTYASHQALQSVLHCLSHESYILSLQNGLGNDEILLNFASENRLIIGMTTWPADKTAAGCVKNNGKGIVRMQALNRKKSKFVENLAIIMTQAGLNTTEDKNVWNSIWEKVAFNAAMNAICAITGCSVGQLTHVDTGVKLVYDTVKEALDVSIAMGNCPDLSHCLATVDFALKNHTHHQPSMLQDIEAGRKTEIMSINGKIAEYGDKQGVPTPINHILTTLMRLKTQQ